MQIKYSCIVYFIGIKCAVSVPETDLIPSAVTFGADLIEVRLDCTGDIPPAGAKSAFSDIGVPLIITLRSTAEGGSFAGGPQEWWEIIEPLLPFAAMVDVETQFRMYSPLIRERGVTVISSLHTGTMPVPRELLAIETDLRQFGDIPKIVVRPSGEEDILTLISFTLHAEKPVITSIMGERYIFARAILPFFGSFLLFCHAGKPTSPGQLHVSEWKTLREILERSF